MNIPFSVCMSVYKNDTPQALATAVKSVVNQTCQPSEIILVQDGPVDESLSSEIESLKNEIPILRLIRLPKNLGHAGARKAAMNAATCDLIAIMDSDDISVCNRFELQIKAYVMHPEVSVIGGQISEFIKEESNVVGERIVPESDTAIKKYMKSRCPLNLVTVMFRKKDVEEAGGFIDWYCEEDYYLWIRMALKGYKFFNIQENLVNVRVGNEMYRRRGGWQYFKSEARLQLYMLRQGIISVPRYCYNVLGRFIIQILITNNLRGYLFKTLFRK